MTGTYDMLHAGGGRAWDSHRGPVEICRRGAEPDACTAAGLSDGAHRLLMQTLQAVFIAAVDWQLTLPCACRFAVKSALLGSCTSSPAVLPVCAAAQCGFHQAGRVEAPAHGTVSGS